MRDDYMELIDSNVKSRGVFSYILDNDVKKIEKVESICNMLGSQSFTCMPKIRDKNKILVNDLENYVYPKIEEWLTSFYNADYIITDSFHGTVFSIIFNKPFISLCNNERGAARFKSLLKVFNLEDRLFDTQQPIDMSIITKPIDYDLVNHKLNKLRAISMSSLDYALKF